MPVFSPFPSHLIHFITECPDTNNAINTLTLNNELYIYPNPATNNLTVAITNDQLRITNVRVFDITGREMLSYRNNRQNNAVIGSVPQDNAVIMSERSERNNLPNNETDCLGLRPRNDGADLKQIATTAKSGLAMTNNMNGKKININITSLPAGIYFVKVTTDKGTVVRKFVKQ